MCKGAVAERSKQACPLCGADVGGEGIQALGKHFRHCPKTASDQKHHQPRGRKE